MFLLSNAHILSIAIVSGPSHNLQLFIYLIFEHMYKSRTTLYSYWWCYLHDHPTRMYITVTMNWLSNAQTLVGNFLQVMALQKSMRQFSFEKTWQVKDQCWFWKHLVTNSKSSSSCYHPHHTIMDIPVECVYCSQTTTLCIVRWIISYCSRFLQYNTSLDLQVNLKFKWLNLSPHEKHCTLCWSLDV